MQNPTYLPNRKLLKEVHTLIANSFVSVSMRSVRIGFVKSKMKVLIPVRSMTGSIN